MSIVTFGLYEVYWFYKNWKVARENGEDVLPWARSIFCIFFAHLLFTDIASTSRASGVTVSWRPRSLTILFIVLQFAWRLPEPAWLISFASVIPLVIAQRAVARVHAALGLDPAVNSRFTWLNILGIVFGSLWMLLVLLALFAPDPAS